MALLTRSVERMTCTRALPSLVMARRIVLLLMVFRFLLCVLCRDRGIRPPKWFKSVADALSIPAVVGENATEIVEDKGGGNTDQPADPSVLEGLAQADEAHEESLKNHSLGVSVASPRRGQRHGVDQGGDQPQSGGGQGADESLGQGQPAVASRALCGACLALLFNRRGIQKSPLALVVLEVDAHQDIQEDQQGHKAEKEHGRGDTARGVAGHAMGVNVADHYAVQDQAHPVEDQEKTQGAQRGAKVIGLFGNVRSNGRLLVHGCLLLNA